MNVGGRIGFEVNAYRAGSLMRSVLRSNGHGNPRILGKHVMVTSDRLSFTDPSNHLNNKLQMVLAGVSLPFFGWLTYIGFSRGIYARALGMDALVTIAAFGWLRALMWLVRPFQYNVEFNSDCLRIWNTRDVAKEIKYQRTDIQRILIERPNVSFGTKSSRIEKGIPGIQWTDERIDQLELFLANFWPEVRIDRL